MKIKKIKSNLLFSRTFYFKISEDRKRFKNKMLFLFSFFRIVKDGAV